MKFSALAVVTAVVVAAGTGIAWSAEIKLLSTGAFLSVAKEVVPQFEKQSGHKVTISSDTAGGLKKRIDGGEAFDIAVITPAFIDELAKGGKVLGDTHVKVATVGIGVGIKEGAPKPDISTVDAFKKTLLDAKAVAYIDPAGGGSSGIYIDKMLDRLGIGGQVKPKAKMKLTGYVADFVANGEADLVLHQISEIVPVKGVALVGPLPADIQNITTYSGAVGAQSKEQDAARALLKALAGPQAEPVLRSKGMQPAS